MRLEVGSKAPDFTLPGADGTDVSLANLLLTADKGVVVYFYPKAGTPGCTKQACDFRDNLSSLKSAGYTVVGISPDPVEKLAKFVEKEELNFPLASDPEHSVIESYGAWGEKKNYGRTYVGLIRSTIVISPEGIIDVAQYNVRATGHVAKLRRDLKID